MLRNRLEVPFRFSGQVTAIRYLDRLPEVGEMVELGEGSWRIASLTRKPGWVGYDVLCERLEKRRLRDLADGLLRRVRRQSLERERN